MISIGVTGILVIFFYFLLAFVIIFDVERIDQLGEQLCCNPRIDLATLATFVVSCDAKGLER